MKFKVYFRYEWDKNKKIKRECKPASNVCHNILILGFIIKTKKNWRSGNLLLIRTSVTRKNAKCLKKLHKNDFTRKMNDFNTFTKIA